MPIPSRTKKVPTKIEKLMIAETIMLESPATMAAIMLPDKSAIAKGKTKPCELYNSCPIVYWMA